LAQSRIGDVDLLEEQRERDELAECRVGKLLQARQIDSLQFEEIVEIRKSLIVDVLSALSIRGGVSYAGDARSEPGTS
jgi:hypothetical protein